jgi:hypothetical protein
MTVANRTAVVVVRFALLSGRHMNIIIPCTHVAVPSILTSSHDFSTRALSCSDYVFKDFMWNVLQTLYLLQTTLSVHHACLMTVCHALGPKTHLAGVFFGHGEVVELVKRVFWTLLCIPVSGMGAIEL